MENLGDTVSVYSNKQNIKSFPLMYHHHGKKL